MKIFHKILGMTLPAVLVALVMGSWLTYYLSRQSLDLIAERWLDTRLAEAVNRVAEHEEFLRLYNITNIAAGTKKAQLDATRGLAQIRIGTRGYVYVLDMTGRIVFHPDAAAMGQDVSGTDWFLQMLRQSRGAVSYRWQGERHLGMFAAFNAWGWIIVATDPLSEIYGPVNHAKKYITALAVLGSMGISLLIIFLTRRLVHPLGLLVDGARKVGQGDLDVRLPVTSSDEIGQVSRAFNTMSGDLKQSLGALRQSEQYFRALTENSSDLIALLSPDQGRINYLSPSITRLLGFRSAALKGRPFSDLMLPRERAEFSKFLSYLAASPRDILFREFAFKNSDGQERILEISGRNLSRVPGIEGIVVNSRDMTTRKKIEDELKASEFRLHQLSSRLISAQEDERKRLSVELHDEVGQSLAVLKLKVILLEEGLKEAQAGGCGNRCEGCRRECEAMVEYIDQLIENVRRLSKDLTPSTIEDLGLSAALMWLMDTIKQHYTIHGDINLDNLDQDLSLDSQILVYRIFQEAIANAVRHAQADELDLNAFYRGNRFEFSIRDNGRGFDPEDSGTGGLSPKGLGLATMQERARMLGGNFSIKTAPGKGTLLQFSMPIDKNRSHEYEHHHTGGRP
ncbi:MAG: HAMP domain-containing protein [Desulfobacter sp.]|nr:MAG: HAMP domain-containing protein [Desulfobacter sp.]